MTEQESAVLRAAVRAEVLSAGLGVTQAQADDISRRICAQERPEITPHGGIRFPSGTAIGDILAALKAHAAHLFDLPAIAACADAIADATRTKLKAMKAGDRLEAANAKATQGITGTWVKSFREASK